MSDYPRLDETGLTHLVDELADKIKANENVQSDWNISDSTSDAFIKNKPSNFNPDNLSSSSNTPTDSETLITKEGGSWVTKTFGKGWDYIKGKIGISASGSTEKYLNEQGAFAKIPALDESPSAKTVDYAPIISVSDALAVNAKDIKAKIEPVQDLHGYDKPWVGGAGKNLFDVNTTPVSTSSVSLETNPSLSQIKIIANSTSGWQQVQIPLALNNGTYTVSITGETTSSPFSGSQRFILYNVTTQVGQNLDSNNKRTFTVDNDTWQLMLRLNQTTNADVGQYVVWSGIQVESGSTATAFEPYSNICPITGWDEVNVTRSGKNLLPFDLNWVKANNTSGTWNGNTYTLNGITFVVNNDGTVNVNGTASRADSLLTLTRQFSVKAGVSYTLSGGLSNDGGAAQRIWVVSSSAFPAGHRLTSYNAGVYEKTTQDALADEVCEVHIWVKSGITLSNQTFKPMIRLASITDDTFEPYKANDTYTIDLNGTRYGGTLDVTTGELTLTHKYSALPTTFSVNTMGNKLWMLHASIGDTAAVSVQNTDTQIRVKSNIFEGVSANEATNSNPYYSFAIISDRRYYLIIPKSDYATLADVNAMIGDNNGEVIYEITPQTIQLTPTQIKMLQGNNTLFSDTGDTQLTYYNSTIGNIGEAVGELENDKANKSDLASINVTGTTNSTGSTISSGTYFYLNDVLVKAKVDIASGATFTKNTNYEEVTAGSLNDMNSKMDYMFNIIRGRQLPIIDLGTSYSSELKSDISSGRFEKAIVGGKLTINGHVYYLAHPDYWLHTGSQECATHHMLVVPAESLASGKMNNDDSTAGGYIGSGMKSGVNHDASANSALADAAAIIKADFGAANILTHKEYFTNAVANGKPSGGAWRDSDIDLMNENMVYGGNILSIHPDGGTIPEICTIDKTQLKLFAERPDLITIHSHWWLRDIVSDTAFARVVDDGRAAALPTSYSIGVRPVFAIC